MPNSLLTGVSGLIAHQRLLDVVGHNIANINTHGYKAGRVLFADLLYETMAPAQGPSATQAGTNPNQVGGGVAFLATDKRFSQGSIEATGEQFDLAISGEGFFVVTDGTNDFYTRTGTFTVDEAGMLATVNGLYVKRFSTAGEADGINPAFQVSGDERIRIPERAAVAGVVTEHIRMAGNLDARNTEARTEVQQTNLPFLSGGAPATAGTLLNDLDNNNVNYTTGDKLTIDGFDHEGNLVFVELDVSETTTMQDVIDALNAEVSGTTSSIDTSGRIVIESNEIGGSSLGVRLRDAAGNVGASQLLSHDFLPVMEGKAADTYERLTTIYDVQGRPHQLKLQFTKLNNDVWTMDASMDSTLGVLTDGSIDSITFNDDGTLRVTSDAEITIQFEGIASPQTIKLSVSDPDSTDRLTHNAADSDLQVDPDGSAPGVINDIQVDTDGRIVGSASNGEIFTIAQLAIANFKNEKGLFSVADNLYGQSLNSGLPEIGMAASAGRGKIESGNLEMSNVDIAFEFTRLIVAQRGFSANARTITVSDEMLEELTNIIR